MPIWCNYFRTEKVREYGDVLPDKLPNGPPPSRSEDLSTELTPDVKPHSRGIYRTSQSELEEVRKKISELVEQRLIIPSSRPSGAPVLFTIKGM